MTPIQMWSSTATGAAASSGWYLSAPAVGIPIAMATSAAAAAAPVVLQAEFMFNADDLLTPAAAATAVLQLCARRTGGTPSLPWLLNCSSHVQQLLFLSSP
jgi:hypothetical protein